MKRIIKASLDDSKYYYLVTIGSGLAWPYLYVVETDYDYFDDGTMDALIDYIDDNDLQQLIDPFSDDNAYAWGEDEKGHQCLVEEDNPSEVAFYEDEYVVGGNYGKVLVHYGQFDITEINADDAKKYVKEDKAILVEV